jgi:hypothetical protein
MTKPLEVYLWKVSVEIRWKKNESQEPAAIDGYARVTVVHEELEGAMGKALEHIAESDMSSLSADWKATHTLVTRVIGVRRLSVIDVP